MSVRVVIMSCVLISITTFMSLAQDQKFVDSLVHQLPSITNDTIKARTYKQIVELLILNDPEAAARYVDLGMKHVVTMKWKKGVAIFNTLIGALESDRGDYASAAERYRSSYAFHISVDDYYNAASSLNNWGSAYQRQSVFDKASEKYFEALTLAEKIENDYLIAVCMSNIAKVYAAQNDLDKAMTYDLKALDIQLRNADNAALGDTYVSIANTYILKKDSAHAREYYENALAHYEKSGNRFGLASVYTNMANLFSDNKVVLDHRLKAQAIWDELSPSYTISIVNLGNLAFTWLEEARRDPNKTSRAKALAQADMNVNRAIRYCLDANDKANYAFLIGARSELEAEMKNYEQAYSDAVLFHHLTDSIYSQDSKNKIAAIEGSYEVAIRDKRIELDALTLSTQRKQNIALVAGVILLLGIGLLLFRQNRMSKHTNNKLVRLNSELAEANEVKAKFFAILSHDLRSPLARLINLIHLQKNDPDLLTATQSAKHQERVVLSAESLLETIETTLLWSKGQMAEFKPVVKKILVSDVFDHLQDTFKGYDNIQFLFSASDHVEIATDENYLFTIMQNLTANSVKALNGVPSPKICWRTWKDNGEVFISITDNGPGLTNSQVAATRSNKPYNNDKNGFGFFIVRDLAQAIHCQVEIQNNRVDGTVIQLRLPENLT